VLETEVGSPVVSLPWSAWHGDTQLEIHLPPEWHPVWLPPADGPALDAVAIARALDTPEAAPPIEEVVRGRKTVAIAVDDLSRPLQARAILEPLLVRLRGAGIRDDDVTIIIATGAHRPATTDDFAQKIGLPLMSRVRTISHNPERDLADTGVSLAGVPIRVNETFLRAGVRLGVCTVLPHPFAGFSGGGKIVIPGLADLNVLERTHRYALMGLQGGIGLATNRFRDDMENAVARIGLHWTVNVVTNSRREVAAIASGDFVRAHRAAAAAATQLGSTQPPVNRLDALILNAYPKDTELLQIETALAVLRMGMEHWTVPDAPIVLTGACADGLGTHGLFGPGGRLFRVPSRKTFLGKRPLIVFSPNVTAEAAAQVFWQGYPVFQTWDAVIDRLRHYLSPGARVGCVPCAPLQLLPAGAAN
jgi:nickel-dependent lactate racemase